ncbi:MAG: hypothetical protein GY751_04915 [Bacteroidetes bacterium]|nr:hypothetical protein [Bacteroidota bacterium]
MKSALFVIFAVLISGHVIAQNPIVEATLEFTEQAAMGEFYPEYQVTFRVELEENHMVDQIRCRIIGDEDTDVINVWVNLDGTNNGTVIVTTDNVTGEILIDVGILEIPLAYVAEITAKVGSTEHNVVEVI